MLHIFDEYYRGYQHSRMILDADGMVAGGRAASVGMTLVDGQIVGDMRRTVRRGSATFDVTLFRHLTDDEVQVIHDAADRYAALLDMHAKVDDGTDAVTSAPAPAGSEQDACRQQTITWCTA